MYTTRNRILFFGSALAVGFAALGLHRYMMENCFDAKGLLMAGNLPGRLLWGLSIGFALCLGAMLTTIGGDGSYEENFPKCGISGLLMIAAGAVLACCVPQLGLEQEAQPVVFAVPWVGVIYTLIVSSMKFLPWLAAVSMIVMGVCRMLGKRAFIVFSGIVCLFYMLMLVTNYRIWSADPKFYEYAFPILAGVLLMLCSFHRTSCEGDVIQRRKLLFTGLTAAACSIASLSGGFMPGFFVSGACWALGSMCDPSVFPPDPEEVEKKITDEPEAV